MKDEIIGGLKNALDRGDSLEKASQSFINAGYSPVEVKAAANMVSPSVSSIIPSSQDNLQQKEQIQKLESQPKPSQMLQPKPSPLPQPIQTSQPAQISSDQSVKKTSKKLVISLVIILLVLLVLLGITIKYADKILSTFFS